MSNLLQLNALTAAPELAEVYVVYNRQDYRMTLATLVSLVTKSSLGLDRVNNTSDLDKPVSAATQTALNLKANVNAVPSIEAFNQLSNSLQNYISLAQLNAAIDQIVTALNNYTTINQVNNAINVALSPVNQSLAQLSSELQAQQQRLSQLETLQQNNITRVVLDEAVALVRQDTQALINDQAASVNATVSQLTNQINLINQSLTVVNAALSTKADINHTHVMSEIEGLEAFIEGVIQEVGGDVSVGVNEW